MHKYKAIKVGGVKYDYHRWLMEQELGRKLDRKEVVHHINENPLYNDVNNLRIMSLSEHSKIHSTGKNPSQSTIEKLRAANLGNQYGTPRKLTDDQVRYVRENYIPYDKEFGARALASKFGIAHSEISRIANRKTYRDIV